MTWSRKYAANVYPSHVLGSAHHKTRVEFETLLGSRYFHHRSDWPPATTWMLDEALILTIPNRVVTQSSCPLNKPYFDNVTTEVANIDDQILKVALLTTPTMRSPQLRHEVL